MQTMREEKSGAITMERKVQKENKNYAEVLIDGVVYTLGGVENEEYLRKVAAYLNEKIGKVRQFDGFLRMSEEYQMLMIELNIADDYFKEQERANELADQKNDLEKDTYSLKHELITTQMKLENMHRELEDERRKVRELKKKLAGAETLADEEEKDLAKSAEVMETTEKTVTTETTVTTEKTAKAEAAASAEVLEKDAEAAKKDSEKKENA